MKEVIRSIAEDYRKIKEIDYKIAFLREKALSPKSPTYSLTPKGTSNGGSQAERFYEKVESLEEEKKTIKYRIKCKKAQVDKELTKYNFSEQEKDVIKLRMYHGVQWKQIAKTLKEKYGVNAWNENKCYREMRYILRKMEKVKL